MKRSSMGALLILASACAGCHRHDDGTAATSSASATAAASGSAPVIRDEHVERAVEQLLGEDRVLRSDAVQVGVNAGIATLSGNVPSLRAKERAVALAGTVKGVRSVVDNVVVTPWSRTDEQIKADILAELHRDPAERAHPVDVTARSAVVTLKGTVDSRETRTMIEDAAKGVVGVAAVDDELVVKAAKSRAPEEIAADVKYRLGNDVWLDGLSLGADVQGRTVRLRGTVASVAQRERASEDAWVDGVDTVDVSGVIVDWWASNNQRHVIDYPLRSDDDIARAVKDAFRRDPRLRVMTPAVTVDAGTVVLTGKVETAKARAAAEDDARNTVGVWRVRDELTIGKDKRPSDKEIEQAAERALSSDVLLSSRSGIHVTSANGRVVIAGTAASAFDRWDALADVASLPGVAEVVDEQVVQKTPSEMKADIEERLSSDPTVERERVSVLVAQDGTVTLTGTVDTWSELRAAAKDARLGGATRVTNQLKLRNHPEVAAPE